jgi:cold shock CspA family protein
VPELEVVRRISLARHLSFLASQSLKARNDLHLFSAANLMQDAIEVFLIALCDHLNVSVGTKSTFDQYFVVINGAISQKELPFKPQLLRLNKIRVASKHDGIQPDRGELGRLFVVAGEFFKIACELVLGESFSTLSTIDLLNPGESKDAALTAKGALDAADPVTCVIECRKAIYLELEQSYSIYAFREGAKQSGLGGLFGPFSQAPYYARNADYIAKSVRSPTDYICIDHDDLDRELSRHGVDHTSYWNLWRLLPAVFRNDEKEWFVEHDFQKLDADVLEENVQYIFDTTIEILLAVHSTKSRVKTSTYQTFKLPLVKPNTPVYEKADRKSTVVGYTPKELEGVGCSSQVSGLNDPGPYWAVAHYENGLFLVGYIHNQDTSVSEVPDTGLVGTIEWFDEARNFGFIQGDNGQRVFVHGSQFTTTPSGGIKAQQRVKYEVRAAQRGPRAVNVTLADN